MPRNVLQQKVAEVLQDAINKSIIATAILREKNSFPASDNRSTEVKEAEAKLRRYGAVSPAWDLIASKVWGVEIKTASPRYEIIKAETRAVVVPVRPFSYSSEEVAIGLPWGTPVVIVNSNSSIRNGSKLFSRFTLSAAFWVPADDTQVEQAVRKLFEDRPAATLKLYGAGMGAVESFLPHEEE